MIPHIVSVKTGSKKRYFLTVQKELVIGMDHKSDLIINHPFFNNGPQTLAINTPVNKDRVLDTGSSAEERFGGSLEIPGVDIRCRSLTMPITIFLILITLALLPYKKLASFTKSSIKQDWSPISLPARDKYGYHRVDNKHPEGIVFTFDADDSSTYTLSFTPGGTDDGSTFSISINGLPLLDSKLLPKGWGLEQTIHIPPQHLRTGGNLVKFSFNPRSTESKQWGIKEVDTVQTTELKTKNRSMADILDSCEAMLNNLVYSGPDLARIYLLLRGLTTQATSKEMAARKMVLINKVEILMSNKVQDSLFRIRSALNMGNESLAEELISQLLTWIPDEWEEGMRAIYVYH
jgi:hypothetical protein